MNTAAPLASQRAAKSCNGPAQGVKYTLRRQLFWAAFVQTGKFYSITELSLYFANKIK